MNFSFSDYQSCLENGTLNPPTCFRPYIKIDKKQYNNVQVDYLKNKHTVDKAFRELRMRVGTKYYRCIYPVQSRTLDYSQVSFPAYRFILPEVLSNDWLSIVDWHKSQRDHALHQPLTAYIVLKLLGNGNPEKSFMLNNCSLLDLCIDEIFKCNKTVYLREYLTDLCHHDKNKIEKLFEPNAGNRSLWNNLFVEVAYIAALFHDLGYPWHYVNRLNSYLEHAEHQINSPTQDASSIIDIFGQRLLFCPLTGYRSLDRSTPVTWEKKLNAITSKALRGTHGLPGAIGFLYLNDAICEFPRERKHPLRQFCVEWAAMAIMMHDMKKIYWGKDGVSTPPENQHLRLQFDVDPLSCIITLADILQDFKRPKVQFPNQNDMGVDMHYNSLCRSTDLEYINSSRTLKIRYEFDTHNSMIKGRKDIEDDQQNYFDKKNGYLDLSSCGIKDVEMIPRISKGSM